MSRLLESAKQRFGTLLRQTVGGGRRWRLEGGVVAASAWGESALPAGPDLSDLEPPPDAAPDHLLEL